MHQYKKRDVENEVRNMINMCLYQILALQMLGCTQLYQ